MTKAKRGDLVVIHKHNRDYVTGSEPREYDTYTVGVVTSVTRDGMVKMFKEAGHVDHVSWDGKPDRGQDLPKIRESVMIVPADVADVAGMLATAACHTWKDHDTQVKYYESLEELRSALAPHRHSETTAARLHEAAVTLETARQAAWQSYWNDTRAQGAGGFDRDRYHAYEAAVTEANETYRQAYRAATEKPSLVAA